ncbi:MAG: hypothetical protein PVJ98_07990 [Akkermansiaceae bacterium]|jgi:hypothetical protein
MPTLPSDEYPCPFCDRSVPVGKNCPCTKPRKKRKKKKRKPDPRPWEKEYDDDGGVPEDSFDYDKFISQEFGEGPAHKGTGIALHWWITAAILFLLWVSVYVF